jgi:transcriptional regulator with XRE-family HTH domain
LSGLRKSGKKKTDLADACGYGKAWVTKLLNGTLKAISDDDARKIEGLLGIRFVQFVDVDRTVSALAAQIDKEVEQNPHLAETLSALLRMSEECRKAAAPFTPRYIETQDMTKVGQEIVRLVFANEDKPGKVAREVLKMLSE